MSDMLQLVVVMRRRLLQGQRQAKGISDQVGLVSDLASGLARCQDFYREAVAAFSPTLPLGGYVGYRRMKEDATPSGLRRIGIQHPG
jgi:hypothetical protein